MWSPNSIHLKNFLSHRDSQYNFKKCSVDIIVGENQDDDGQNSNGSGKSAIVEAIAFAITGELLRDITIDLCISDEFDDAQVKLILQNNVTDQFLVITRMAFRNRPSKLDILLDGERINVITVKTGNEWLEQQIGICKNDLLTYFIVCKSNHTNFLTCNDSEKQRIVQSLSKTENIPLVDSYIKSDLKEIDEQLFNLSNKKSKIVGQKEMCEFQINSNDYQRWITNRDFQIQNKNKQKAEFEQENEQIAQTGKSLRLKLNEFKSQILSHEEIDSVVQSVRNRFEDVQVQVTTKKQKKIQFRGQLDQIEFLIKNCISCPQCQFQFNPTNNQNQVQLSEQRIATISAFENIQDEIQENEILFESVRLQLNTVVEQQKSIFHHNSEIQKQVGSIDSQLSSLKARFNSNVESIKLFDSEIELLSQQEFDFDYKSVTDKIVEFNQSIKQYDKQIQQLNTKKIGLVPWSIYFKQFINFLSENTLKTIESCTNKYLSAIQSSLRVELSNTSQTKAGNTSLKISVFLVRDDGSKSKYARFSSGEQTRINVCNILACHFLLNNNCEHGKGLDLLIIDEIIESVDVNGADAIFKSIENLSQTIIVITHTNHNTAISPTRVVKKNSISYVVQ